MASVAIPMTVLTLTYVAVNVLVWAGLKDKQKTMGLRIAIGILYGYRFADKFACGYEPCAYGRKENEGKNDCKGVGNLLHGAGV